VVGKPPSPSPSDRSLPPFSSGSSVSETSTGSGGSNAVGQGDPEVDFLTDIVLFLFLKSVMLSFYPESDFFLFYNYSFFSFIKLKFI
jgi:hypothetical protein